MSTLEESILWMLTKLRTDSGFHCDIISYWRKLHLILFSSLLSGCTDGSIYIHDLYNFSGLPNYTAKCICNIDKYNNLAHRCSVECTSWFGDDNELFITSGTDQTLKVWDANNLKPVESFTCKGRIFHHDCTSVPSLHPILAGKSFLSVFLSYILNI